jgi:hypothetical protein
MYNVSLILFPKGNMVTPSGSSNLRAEPTEDSILNIVLVPGVLGTGLKVSRRRSSVVWLARASARPRNFSPRAFEEVEVAFKKFLDDAGPPPGWSPTDAEGRR